MLPFDLAHVGSWSEVREPSDGKLELGEPLGGALLARRASRRLWLASLHFTLMQQPVAAQDIHRAATLLQGRADEAVYLMVNHPGPSRCENEDLLWHCSDVNVRRIRSDPRGGAARQRPVFVVPQ